MADGSTKRIDEIEVGDKVASSHRESDNLEQHEVTAIHVTAADKDYIALTILTPEGVKTINTTAHHAADSRTTSNACHSGDGSLARRVLVNAHASQRSSG